MKKLMRLVATLGVSATVAGGALLATSGSATAATAQTVRHVHTQTAAASTGHCGTQGHGAHRGPDPWIMDQLKMFEPAAAKRVAVFDPWVKDQLAMFPPTTR
ncbi:hypothetical protein [Streptomyces carpinensis]|uniref:Uncharacterized protein n=1 Tax=Streptomyces carpinensis TaxID=66369 RepID=A0ABV1WF39_9ACTN|nr:hypothetical protein [Streptomyces carpinensis]